LGASKLLEVVMGGTRRMQTLINDLLAYSRLSIRSEAPGSVDCNAVVKAVLSNLEVAIRDAGAIIRAGPLPVIQGDESQLTQLFQNLISNALKFHGTEPPRIEIGVKHVAAEWQFAVRDNGIGIDPKFHERVFVVFQRLHRRDQYPGTGIGLAICKRVVEHHGGRIWVESARGQGATFYFTIPAAAPHAEADRI
jgi:light-regulated signal transduction histidine kinase (bacteriophytochrome)